MYHTYETDIPRKLQVLHVKGAEAYEWLCASLVRSLTSLIHSIEHTASTEEQGCSTALQHKKITISYSTRLGWRQMRILHPEAARTKETWSLP